MLDSIDGSKYVKAGVIHLLTGITDFLSLDGRRGKSFLSLYSSYLTITDTNAAASLVGAKDCSVAYQV
jgi:hypothetical protein